MTGVGPSTIFFVIAAILAVTQRSRLARALRVPDSNLRRRRLWTAAILGATFVIAFVTYSLTIGDSWTVRETVLAIVGNAALLGGIGYLIAGLLTPRTPNHHIAPNAG